MCGGGHPPSLIRLALAQVTANKEAADGLRLISLEVGAGIASGFKVPGQYVKARSGPSMEKPGFFAIASAPGASASGFDFVIKRTDGSSWICDSAVVIEPRECAR